AYKTAAKLYAATLVKNFWDPVGKGFFYAPADGETLFVRIKEDFDGAMPSANSLGVLALVRAAAALGDDALRAKAWEAFDAAGERLTEAPSGHTTLLLALFEALPAGRPEPLVAAAPESTPNAEPSGDAPGGFKPIQKMTLENDRLVVKPGAAVEGVVRIAVTPGWHINANPARPKFLKPTTIQLAPATTAYKVKSVAYPKGKDSSTGGLDEKVSVYDGAVVIPFTLEAIDPTATGTTVVNVDVRWQACDDEKCLAPTKTTLSLTVVVEP
ncbi:MAG: protein-disulfide reductase DsbD domain-containing protein, partial [Planctomycetia bacterium]